MLLHMVVLLTVIGWPAIGLAQFIDKGEYVEVKKGTTLCPSAALGVLSGSVDRNRVFWKVTSRPRANGTQSVTALTRESVYDRKSGDTTIVETRYDEDYATFFKRVPLHKELLVMISPQDGRSQATVEICLKGK
jgi:hypothetical protein